MQISLESCRGSTMEEMIVNEVNMYQTYTRVLWISRDVMFVQLPIFSPSS